MSMSKEQRQPKVLAPHPSMGKLRVVSARSKHDKRRRVIVVEYGGRTLKEFLGEGIPQEELLAEAIAYMEGVAAGFALGRVNKVGLEALQWLATRKEQ